MALAKDLFVRSNALACSYVWDANRDLSTACNLALLSECGAALKRAFRADFAFNTKQLHDPPVAECLSDQSLDPYKG